MNRNGCGRELTHEPDFESMCEAVVWTNVFREIGLKTVNASDASVTVDVCSVRLPYGATTLLHLSVC
jgi:hypothetical protein